MLLLYGERRCTRAFLKDSRGRRGLKVMERWNELCSHRTDNLRHKKRVTHAHTHARASRSWVNSRASAAAAWPRIVGLEAKRHGGLLFLGWPRSGRKTGHGIQLKRVSSFLIDRLGLNLFRLARTKYRKIRAGCFWGRQETCFWKTNKMNKIYC